MRNKKKCTVSVVIPCHNCSQTIVRAINSILKQSVPVDEIICVNDGSTDKTLKVLRDLEKSNFILKVINFDINVGAAKSRNFGAKEASSEYVAFLDSDDYWATEKIQIQISKMIETRADWSSTAFHIEKNGEIVGQVQPYKNLSLHKVISNNKISTSTVVVKKEIFQKHHFPDLWRSQDLALWIILIRSKLVYTSCNDSLAYYQIGETSLSSNKILSSIWVARAIFYSTRLGDFYLVFSFCLYLINGLVKHLSWRISSQKRR